ncbi:MAG: DUF92 domain-containing protein [Gemmatimonadales bacterium]
MNPLVAVTLAALFSALAWRVRWLTGGGATAGTLVASLVFTGSGFSGAILLTLFFVSGSLLTRGEASSRPRTATQVLANGLWAALGGLLAGAGLAPGWTVLAASLAAAQADTWSSEIGTRWGGTPKMITSGKAVPRGTSGGISALGTTGGVAGAFVMAGSFLALGGRAPQAAAALVGGVGGMFADSLLGATVQGRYHCDACGLDTENRVHRCGASARLTGGRRWIDNDAVNFLATGAGALAALALSGLA